MASETFYCPHCKRRLTKSDQAYVLGEAIEKKSKFIVMGDTPPDVTCPGCGGKIDSMKMIKGEYDFPPMSGREVGIFFLIAIVAALVLKLAVRWSWIAAILVGLLAAGLVMQVINDSKRKK